MPVYHYCAMAQTPDGMAHIDGITKLVAPIDTWEAYCAFKKSVSDMESSVGGLTLDPHKITICSLTVIAE